MSADGAALNPDHAIEPRGSSSDPAQRGALPGRGEADVLRNSLSAVMLEYHEQSKKSASMAADQARQSQEIARLTAQNLQLSRNLAALADAATRRAAAEAERDQLRARCSELEKRLFDIEASTLWVATRRLRKVFTRHPRLRRFVKTIRLALARP
jgi:DNA-binding response OmpR family regulator